jgi:raffinose/stachyose/melibiose transport system permease protein
VRARRAIQRWWVDGAALLVLAVVFVVPFLFILLTAAMSQLQASSLDFVWPTNWQLFENLQEVLSTRDGLMVTSIRNSVIVTVGSVTLIVIFSAMTGFVLQRRRDRVGTAVAAFMLAGLIIPPAVVPTIYVLQALGVFKTIPGLILVEVAFIMPFAVLVFRAFAATIPRELDEAAIIDGASPLRFFWFVIFPLLRPAVITVIVIASITVYNDFVNPLYFLPGTENSTVQLTLYGFQSQFSTQWHLLFAASLLITLPPLIMFIFFQRQIVSGMAAGAVKG